VHIHQIRIQNNLAISVDSIAKENSPNGTGTCLMGSEKVNVVCGLAAGGRKCMVVPLFRWLSSSTPRLTLRLIYEWEASLPIYV